MINPRLEYFPLFYLVDDWMFWENLSFLPSELPLRRQRPPDVAEVVRDLATRGLIELGSWSDDGQFEVWDVPPDEALDRTAHGFQGEAGYLSGDAEALGRTEVFRANLTALG